MSIKQRTPFADFNWDTQATAGLQAQAATGLCGLTGSAGMQGQTSSIASQCASSIASQCASERDPGEIPQRLKAVFGMTDHLSDRLSRLRGRLEPVLMARSPANGKKEQMLGCSQIGNALQEIAMRLDLMIEAVDEIDGALQL